jgi:hypothetical protein
LTAPVRDGTATSEVICPTGYRFRLTSNGH